MVIAPKETVEKTKNAFPFEHCAAVSFLFFLSLRVCVRAARDAVLELFQRITGGRNVLPFSQETWHLGAHTLLAAPLKWRHRAGDKFEFILWTNCFILTHRHFFAKYSLLCGRSNSIRFFDWSTPERRFVWLSSTHMQTAEERPDYIWRQSCSLLCTGTSRSRWSRWHWW